MSGPSHAPSANLYPMKRNHLRCRTGGLPTSPGYLASEDATTSRSIDQSPQLLVRQDQSTPSTCAGICVGFASHPDVLEQRGRVSDADLVIAVTLCRRSQHGGLPDLPLAVLDVPTKIARVRHQELPGAHLWSESLQPGPHADRRDHLAGDAKWRGRSAGAFRCRVPSMSSPWPTARYSLIGVHCDGNSARSSTRRLGS